jgi:hypothetical protein
MLIHGIVFSAPIYLLFNAKSHQGALPVPLKRIGLPGEDLII